MGAEWWQAVFAGLAILVPIALAFAAGAAGRAKRRGEQAGLAFQLARMLREEKNRQAEERILSADAEKAYAAQFQRMDDTARFMASEYSRYLLRDGMSGAVLGTLIAYGVFLFLVGWEAGSAAQTVQKYDTESMRWFASSLMLTGVGLVLFGAVALIRGMLRRQRMREAGLPIKSAWAELREMGQFYTVMAIRARERAARTRALRSVDESLGRTAR